ncbi:MAG TPA: hypothetical protein VFV71_06850, partial [Burkholderiales bacterium]|nr:hypothetical protein [Burkholderiales bacterium]
AIYNWCHGNVHATMGNLIDWDRIAAPGVTALPDFGDPVREFEAARSGVAVSPATRFGQLLVHGADAASFLQAQLTCDVDRLAPGQAGFGGYCTPKGRLLATFVVVRVAQGYLMHLPADTAEDIAARLRRFVLRARVKIETDSGWRVLGIAGPGTGALIGGQFGVRLESSFAAAAGADATVVRLPGEACVAFAPAQSAGTLWQALASQAVAAGDDCWAWVQIRSRMPWISAATQDQFLPQMVGLDAIGGVSFGKGCYPGQEIVARARYLGEVRRRLWDGTASGVAHAGDTLESGGQPVGTVLTAAPLPSGGSALLAVVVGHPGECTLAGGGSVTLVPAAD